jgi:hypothetical protein
MKKALFLLAVVAMLSFKAQAPAEKTFSLKFTESKLNGHWKNLLTIKQVIDESNLPHQQAKFVNAAVDSLMKDIAEQIQPQLQDTTKPKK